MTDSDNSNAEVWRPKGTEIVWLCARKERGVVGMSPGMDRLDFEETVHYSEELERLAIDLGVPYSDPPHPPTWLDCIDFIAHLETVLEDANVTVHKPGIAMEEPADNREHTAKHPLAAEARLHVQAGVDG